MVKAFDPAAPRPLPTPAAPAPAKTTVATAPTAAAPTPTPVASLRSTVADGFGKLRASTAQTLSAARNVHVPNSAAQVEGLFGWGKSDVDKLADSTAGFRQTATQLASVKGQLAKLPADAPSRPALEAQLSALQGTMQSKYGYANGTPPPAGSLWIDPAFLGKELPGGQVTGSRFPAGTPVTRPPSPLEAMFAGGRSYSLTTADGKTKTFKSASEYQAFLADNRAAQKMPRTDGEPVGVQMNFEGGGGKGKRYGPALNEMASLGVIPTSCAGSSAGAICAGLVAGGADAAEVNRFCTDPKLASLFDLDLGSVGGGVADGKAAYEMFDQELRKLTGITDRPVTFADLKIPLQICATKMSDTDPAPGTGDLSKVDNRIFVFSQETTPNTPVALAIRASMAIPAAFDPVDVLDPTTGRQLKLVDGGVLDNLPMRESPKFGLPAVGLKLSLPEDHDPANHARPTPDALKGGNLNVDNVILNGLYGKQMHDAAHTQDADFQDLVKPKAGQFMVGLPVFDLNDPSKADSTLKFGYDAKVDPVLDQQTRQVTRDFFRQTLAQLSDPTASATNVHTDVGSAFNTSVQLGGRTYAASYTGGDSVAFKQQGGADSFSVKLGADKIRALMIDGASYGNLEARLAKAAGDAGHRAVS